MPYRHFKLEGMKDVIDLLNQGNYMIKIDLKDAYWHIPIHPTSQKYLRFQWKEKLYEMLVLAFGVGPGKNFHKTIKSSPNDSEKTNDLKSGIPRRFINNRKDNGRSHELSLIHI